MRNYQVDRVILVPAEVDGVLWRWAAAQTPIQWRQDALPRADDFAARVRGGGVDEGVQAAIEDGGVIGGV
jgi:hypothetical protein